MLVVSRLSHDRPTGRTVVLLADLADNLVHRPAVELVVAQNLERQAVLDLILLDGLYSISFSCSSRIRRRTHLERVVAVSGNAFVDRKQKQVQAIVVPLIQRRHDMRKHRRV
jgi:hypothetical protein